MIRTAQVRLFCILVAGIFAAGPLLGAAGSSAGPIQDGSKDPESSARMLLDRGEWAALLERFPPSAANTAEIEFCRAMALARLGRLADARQALESGREKAPRDKRFYLELAGIAYRLGDSGKSRRLLARALKLSPKDPYGNDFLATVYLLQGNLEAALKYWNRVGRPRIEEVKTIPVPKVDPVLLDRTFAFSPASRLTLRELNSTQARLDLMKIFPSYRFELAPRQDGDFDLLFHSEEHEGWGGPIYAKLISFLREIPYQTVHLDGFNLGGSASNLETFYRWDAQKRRVFASFSRPLKGDPGWRFSLWADGRDENWDIPPQPQQSSPILFKLKKVELGAGVASAIGASWAWHSHVSISERRFIPSSSTARVAAALFADGLSLKYEAGLRRRLIYLPERRLKIQSSVAIQLAKIWTGFSDSYLAMDVGVKWDWHPVLHGDGYLLSGRLRAGEILGHAPIDELFRLGMERDDGLYLRGHPGTLQGMKGAGPLGRGFVLVNNEMDKVVHEGGFWRFSLGPFFDFGNTYDNATGLGSREWLWDAGLQAKFAILRRLTFTFSCGWNLQTGKATLYTGTLDSPLREARLIRE
jgi:tetratricopeptide (TPR) repeat protein